ncbi:MAG TPA: glycoside hydrolase family 57 protein [Syntrophomonadaceae bacterium]|nr:glycoside hydrolase family 57 protein [Syntrophomonadaceae bacterium]
MMVLHSHIPYVKHQGRWPFGEVWLFEAMAETYIPFLKNWMNMKQEGKEAKITLSLSPVLLEQLNSKYIQKEFINYLKEREALALEDERFFLGHGDKELATVASIYYKFYRDIRRDFITDFDMEIVGVLKSLLKNGDIEIITSAATHAYLPLIDKPSLEHQVILSKQTYEKMFGAEPKGFWLPECGYSSGVEDILIEHDFSYFYVDSHAIEGGRPIEIFSQDFVDEEVKMETFASTGLSTYRPYRLKDKDITVFGRNSMISHQVWSADYGYPGDEDYREFHKTFERSGFKYWKITDRNKPKHKKVVYDYKQAELRAHLHAAHFIDSLENTSREAVKLGFPEPLIVGCYDTELFGHWWWEGTKWLDLVMRSVSKSNILEFVLPSQIGAVKHEAEIFDSSWGLGGKHFVWENKETTWMWDIIKKSGGEYEELNSINISSDLGQRAKNMALRELMLIQSSDWLFMVTNNSTKDYAMKRFFEHYTKFLRIIDCVYENQMDKDFEQWLEITEKEDGIFL